MTVYGADSQPEEPHRSEQEGAFDDDDAIPVASELPSKHVDEEDERSLLIPDITVWDATFGPHFTGELEEILIGHQQQILLMQWREKVK